MTSVLNEEEDIANGKDYIYLAWLQASFQEQLLKEEVLLYIICKHA